MSRQISLQSPRLTLRPVAPGDEGAVVDALNDLDVSGWLTPVPYPYAPADFHHFLNDYVVPGETFAVEDAKGFAGILGIEDDTLGYWFTPQAQGKGYATEAARAALAARFAESPDDVASGYFEGNLRSANVLRKLGFVAVGQGMRHCRALGIDRAHIDMCLTRDAFVAALPVEAQSARLTYRAMQATDTDALHVLHSDWAVVRQLGSWSWPPQRDFAASRARPYSGDGFAWGVFLSGRLIGTFGYTDGIIGYSLAQAHWGQGYGTELLTTGLAHGMRHFPRAEVTASVWHDNPASQALLRRMGFRWVEQTVEMSKARKVEVGLDHFTLTRADWLARPVPGDPQGAPHPTPPGPPAP
jgi:RimJ/RimL family protein N-acetyltransferase